METFLIISAIALLVLYAIKEAFRTRQIANIQHTLNNLAMTFEQFKGAADEKLAAIQTAIAEEQAQVLAATDKMTADLADLRALIEANQGQEADQLALLANLENVVATVRSIYTPPVVEEEVEGE